MDEEVIRTKIEALIRCVFRIESQKVSSLEELESNLDKQEIITKTSHSKNGLRSLKTQ
jgi:hypothetical protein